MEVLTDEMIAKLIQGNVHMMLWIFIASAVVLLLFMVSLMKGIVEFKKDKRENKKSFFSQERGLLITIAVTGTICLALCLATFGTYKSADNWHLEYATVSDKEIEVDDGTEAAKHTYYNVHINEYPQTVKVSKDAYDTIETGERVYVLVSDGDHADEIWETDRYSYTGNRLK